MLASKGYDVEITKKSDNALTIDNMINLEINGEFGDKSCLIKNVKNNQFTSQKDVLIMCTQSFSTAGALKEVYKYLKPNGIVISMQNVLNINEILKIVPKERYVALIVDWTATRINNNQVFVLRKANMHIGVFSDKAKVFLPIVKKIFDAVQPTIIQDNMMAFIASRFTLNCALSCVLSVTGFKLKFTMQKKTARKLIVGMISEMLQVFEAFGIEVPPYCGMLDYKKFTEKSLSGWWYRRLMFNRFIRQNGNMSSSILKALENKKKSELDSMCARIVDMAKEKGIDVPFNETVANFLYDVEEGKESIFMENLSNPCFENLKIKWR
jgi:2-dehydropantoate 2-reductase